MKCVFCGQACDGSEQAMLAWWLDADGKVISAGAYHNGRSPHRGCQGAAENTGYLLLDRHAEAVTWDDLTDIILRYPKWDAGALRNFVLTAAAVTRLASAKPVLRSGVKTPIEGAS